MGPRSIDRGITDHFARGFSSPHGLQWGRDQLIAEFAYRPFREPVSCQLQWGRDQLIAELGLRRGALLPCQLASMGPRSIDRGIVAGAKPPRASPVASMGPRSIDRGIDLVARYCGLLIKLQWGRDQLIAELRRPPRT